MASQPNTIAPEVLWSPPSPANGTGGPADVILVGYDGIAVLAHRTTLMHTTEIFDAILGLNLQEKGPQDGLGEPIRIDMQESGQTLCLVIPLLYNIPPLDVSAYPSEDILAAYIAAHKYTAYRALEHLRLGLANGIHRRYSNHHFDTALAAAMPAYLAAVKLGDAKLEKDLAGLAGLAVDNSKPYAYANHDELGMFRANLLFQRKRIFLNELLSLLRSFKEDRLREQFWVCQHVDTEFHRKLRQQYNEWIWWALYNATRNSSIPVQIDFDRDDGEDNMGAEVWLTINQGEYEDGNMHTCEQDVYATVAALMVQRRQAWLDAGKRQEC